MKTVIATVSIFCGFQLAAADLTVPSGETLDISENVTYGTVTVNGTLNVKGGTLTATTVCISSGADQKSGVLVVDGGSLSVTGDSGNLYIGHDGGTGRLELKQSSKENLVTYLTMGHGGGDGNVYEIHSGLQQGRKIINKGTGSKIVFAGGYFKLSETCFTPVSGDLTLSSKDGNTMQLRPFNTGTVYLFDPGAENTGSVCTEGEGALSVYSLKSGGSIRLAALSGGRMTWGHSGGIRIVNGASAACSLQAYESGDFFCQGGMPQKIVLSADTGKGDCVLDVQGQVLTLGGISAMASSVVTNTLTTSGALRILCAEDETVGLSGENIVWDGAVGLVKAGNGRLDLSFDGFAGALKAESGVLNVATNIAPASVSQEGGEIRIAEDCTLSLDGTVWESPAMTDDSAGTVETSGACTFTGDEISLNGGLKVVSGTLTCPGFSGRTWHRYFRLTMKHTTARSSNCLAFSRFRLMDSDGNVLSDGLTKAAAGTDPSALEPGTCCYAEAYSENDASDVTHLFDGLATTQICLTKCSFGSDISQNTWRIICFRLPDTAVAPVSKYQMTTGTDTGKLSESRMVTAWTLESSADGVNWQEIDARSGYLWDSLPDDPGQDMDPYALQTAAPGPKDVSVGTLAVASGASADFTAGNVSVAELAVAMDAYAEGTGSIGGLSPSSVSEVSLTGTPKAMSYVLPLSFPGFPDGIYRWWHASLDGSASREMRVRAEDGVIALSARVGSRFIVK